MEYDFWVENHKGWYKFDYLPELQFMFKTIEDEGGKPDRSREKEGLMTYEDYESFRKSRKAGYRRRFYNALSDEERNERKRDKLHRELAKLRSSHFKIRCTQYCFDFNCQRCVSLRRPIAREIEEKELELKELDKLP